VAKLKYAVTGQMKTSSDEFRALRSLGLVAGSFVVCWLPMTIAFFFTDRNTDPATFHRTFSFTAPLAVVNAIIDPSIYYYRSKGFRVSLKTLTRRLENVGF
jgi:branched-subunit amino acid transport protein